MIDPGLTSAIAVGKAHAESRFTETLTFFARGLSEDIPEGQIDPVVVDTDVYTDIAGQIKVPDLQVSDQETAGQLVATQQAIAKVAVGATPNVRPDHFCRVTASLVDAALVGRQFRVTGMPVSGQVTSHRYPIEEAT